MFYINDNLFKALMEGAKPIETRSPRAMQERLAACPVLREFDSGEIIGASSGQWEERARLYDTLTGELVLEVQAIYYGERYGNRSPHFWSVPKSLYEEALSGNLSVDRHGEAQE